MRARHAAASLLLLLLHSSALPNPLPCSSEDCVISSAIVLQDGDNTCCSGTTKSLTLDDGASLTCPAAGQCSLTIANIMTFTVKQAEVVNVSNFFVSSDTIAFNAGASIFAGHIRITATTNSSFSGISCTSAVLSAAASAGDSAGKGTPLVPGAYISKRGLAAGLGAAHAGAGATGIDATVSSLFQAGATYPSGYEIFSIATALTPVQLGSRGGLNNCTIKGCVEAPFFGQGGGIVALYSSGSITLDSCTMLADGGSSSGHGAGSGGTVVLAASSNLDVKLGTLASANGGNSTTMDPISDFLCSTYPCGMPGGGGFVYASSGASSANFLPLEQWASASGGSWSNAPYASVCAGGGILIDCQTQGVDVDASACDVTVAQSPVCLGSTLACNDGESTSGPCLIPPTPLSCSNELCNNLHVNPGANVSIGSMGIHVNGTLSATSASFSADFSSFTPQLHSRSDMTLANVGMVIKTGVFRNVTVYTDEGDLLWTVVSDVDLSVVGSLSIFSTTRAVTLDFDGVSVTPPPGSIYLNSCTNFTWQGLLIASAGTDLQFVGNNVNVSSLQLYAANDVDLPGPTSVRARGCGANAGVGAGANKTVAATIFIVGGGGAHAGAGGVGFNGGFGPDALGGGAYDLFPLTDVQLFSGSGGGGNGAGALKCVGGRGGGTIVIAGNRTLISSSPTGPNVFDASGDSSPNTAPFSAPTGGGGGGGTIVVAFSYLFDGDNGESTKAALKNLNLMAGGGAGVSGETVGIPSICGGGGGGGNVVIGAPLNGQPTLPPDYTPTIGVLGGAKGVAGCFGGSDGKISYMPLPPPPSPSSSSSISSTPSVTPTFTPSQTATSSQSPSPTGSPSGSDTQSSTVTVTATETATPSLTPTLTPSITATLTPSPTTTATYVPAPPAMMLGLTVPAFYAVAGGGGALAALIVGVLAYRAFCQPAGQVRLLDGGGASSMPGAPRGSLWNDAYNEKTSLMRSPPGEAGGFDRLGESFRSGRSYYIPPSGVV